MVKCYTSMLIGNIPTLEKLGLMSIFHIQINFGFCKCCVKLIMFKLVELIFWLEVFKLGRGFKCLVQKVQRFAKQLDFIFLDVNMLKWSFMMFYYKKGSANTFAIFQVSFKVTLVLVQLLTVVQLFMVVWLLMLMQLLHVWFIFTHV